ncbi:alpha/beta hydrolase [Roseomonas sp. OT10]|uniref:alpha/beta hydrolase n=1 Tax=Roseomonas cutis TaxID=2897332 RepID=UPI001E4873E5|nr:alpha/beta hydrolase [Roseomonas sp. OT10]UFN49406.1 alpha/beta hydrolase [Roseomonas sp. OT10]
MTTEPWHGRDQAWLDTQYNCRATVPDMFAILAEYRSRTDAAKAALPHVADLRYGPHERNRLDVYPAAAPGPAPVLVFIHGGYWRMLDAADSGAMAPGLTAAGACTVALDYVLRPEATVAEIVAQCRAGLAWVRESIARHGGDPARIHLAGSSAGGHLAGMLLDEAGVTGATLLSGLYELEPVRLSYVNDWAELDEAAVARLSPARRPVPPGLHVVMSVGDTETAEFKRQTASFAALLRAGGCAVEEVAPRPGSNHFDIIFDLGDPASPLHRATLRAMGLAAR